MKLRNEDLIRTAEIIIFLRLLVEITFVRKKRKIDKHLLYL